ncbi:MAG: 50S ribosomal protein L3 [bacterium]|nr:50S ribosomal protein L3 [bacterium]
MNTLLGKKSEMTTRFDKNGKKLTVTTVTVTPNYVIERKENDKAGYTGIVLGSGSKKRAAKPFLKKVATLGVIPHFMKEVRSDEAIEVGTTLNLSDVFSVGDFVKVTGNSKGKGFTGVVKRYNFRGGPKTHGQSDRWRARGSLGSGTTPGRVFKGKRMAGRQGGDSATVRNLTVAYINEELNQLFLTGPVPGHKNSILVITKVGENKRFPGIEEIKMDAMKVAEAPVEEVKEEIVEAIPANEVTQEDIVAVEETK